MTTIFRPPLIYRIVPPSADAAVRSQDDVRGQNLLLSAPASAAPFRLLDWPNPVSRVYAIPPEILGANLNLAPPPAAPFYQTEWATPPGARPISYDHVQGRNLALTTAPVVMPFRQTEWLVPHGARPIAYDHTCARNLPLTTATPPFTFRPKDQPNPTLAPYPEAAINMFALNGLGLNTPIVAAPDAIHVPTMAVNLGTMMGRF